MKIEDIRRGMRVCCRYDDDTTFWGTVVGTPVERVDVEVKKTQVWVEVEWEIGANLHAHDVNIAGLYPESAVDRLGNLA